MSKATQLNLLVIKKNHNNRFNTSFTTHPVTYLNLQSTQKFNIITSLENVLKTAQKGQKIIFKYVITNTGKKTIYNVKIVGQELEKKLGTLKPGETKKIICTYYIYADAELEEIFGPGTTESNPLYVGTGTLNFEDAKGGKYTQELNPVGIKLV
ncbi:MAG: hypothetical protein PHY59_00405 [Methanobacterium sp.]|nr:hypothetical protein [Methanobacterium sp.]